MTDAISDGIWDQYRGSLERLTRMDFRHKIYLFDPDALPNGVERFSTADDTGGGNTATHLVATHWRTWSHTTCNATVTQKHPP